MLSPLLRGQGGGGSFNARKVSILVFLTGFAVCVWTFSSARYSGLMMAIDTAQDPSAIWSNTTMQMKYIRRTIELAKEAVAAGGSPYGALIVDPELGQIIAEGSNNASHNPIWHGEMSAIKNLSDLSSKPVYAIASSLELYTSAEPCPMCMAAIAWSGFGRVIFGTSIPYIAGQGQNQINIRASTVAARTPFRNITVIGGVLANETDVLYQPGDETKFSICGSGGCQKYSDASERPVRQSFYGYP